MTMHWSFVIHMLIRAVFLAFLIDVSFQCMAQTQARQSSREESTKKGDGKLPMEKKRIAAELRRAAESGDIKALEDLMAKGADINTPGPEGETPLMAAIESKQPKCVRWLLAKGADPNLQDHNDRSAVSLAAGLVDDSDILGAVLKHGGNPNIVQRKSQLYDGSFIYPNTTPLYEAILAANKPNVALLIKAGAILDPNIDEETVSPLRWAIALRRFDIAYMLIEAEADFRTANPADGLTVVDVLEDVNLTLIGIDEFDDQKREQLIKDQTRWYFRVVKLLGKKGIKIRRTQTDVVATERGQN